MSLTPELLALFDHYERIEITFPGTLKETPPGLVRITRPPPGMSFIQYSQLDDASAGAAIAGEIAHFRQLGQPFNWKHYSHDQPADLGQRLQAAGLEADEPDTVMLYDLAAGLPIAPLLPANVRLLSVRQPDAQALAHVAAVLESVWGGSFAWVHTRLGGHLAIPGYLSIYLAYLDERPASAAWMYLPAGSPFASLWAGSTIPTARRLGLYRALLAARAAEAQAHGRRYLVVDAGPQSAPILAANGFTPLTTSRDYTWRPG